MVEVKSLRWPEISVPWSWAGSSADTTRVAISATTERPRQTTRNRQRSRGITDDSQAGRSPWTTLTTNHAIGIAAASVRLR